MKKGKLSGASIHIEKQQDKKIPNFFTYLRNLTHTKRENLKQKMEFRNEKNHFWGRGRILDHYSADLSKIKYKQLGPKTFFLYNVKTLEYAKKEGLATQLLAETINIIKTEGKGKTIYLHVERNSHAKKIYEQFGFKPNKDKLIYSPKPNSIQMKLTLKKQIKSLI